jgi:hypothetical protein
MDDMAKYSSNFVSDYMINIAGHKQQEVESLTTYLDSTQGAWVQRIMVKGKTIHLIVDIGQVKSRCIACDQRLWPIDPFGLSLDVNNCYAYTWPASGILQEINEDREYYRGYYNRPHPHSRKWDYTRKYDPTVQDDVLIGITSSLCLGASTEHILWDAIKVNPSWAFITLHAALSSFDAHNDLGQRVLFEWWQDITPRFKKCGFDDPILTIPQLQDKLPYLQEVYNGLHNTR